MAPVVREIVHASAQLVDGAVERTRDLAQLVVAVPGGRAREVAGGVAARHARRWLRRDGLWAPRRARRTSAATGSDAGDAGQDEPQHGALLLGDLGQRQRQPHKRDRRMVDPDDGVQRVVVRRRAVAPDQHFRLRTRRPAPPGAARGSPWPPGAAPSSAESPSTRPSVGDQRHAYARELPHPVGFVVELLGRECRDCGSAARRPAACRPRASPRCVPP